MTKCANACVPQPKPTSAESSRSWSQPASLVGIIEATALITRIAGHSDMSSTPSSGSRSALCIAQVRLPFHPVDKASLRCTEKGNPTIDLLGALVWAFECDEDDLFKPEAETWAK